MKPAILPALIVNTEKVVFSGCLFSLVSQFIPYYSTFLYRLYTQTHRLYHKGMFFSLLLHLFPLFNKRDFALIHNNMC
jgi:hypothetical protein